MVQELEIEFKNLLTESEYHNLLSAYAVDDKDAFIQENIYFDTEDYDLKRHHAALRIRIKEEHAEMTLKTPYGNHLLETNVTLSIEEANHFVELQELTLPSEIVEQLEKVGIDVSESFNLITHLKTKRIEKKVEEGLLVFDQSWYAGVTDYELEVEVENEAEGERWFKNVLKQFAIPKRETKNKIQRAFEEMQKNKELK